MIVTTTYSYVCTKCRRVETIKLLMGKPEEICSCIRCDRLGGTSGSMRLEKPAHGSCGSQCACAPFKKCGCGRTYSREEWNALKQHGTQRTEDDDGNPLDLDLRNCSCGSTMAIEVPVVRHLDFDGDWIGTVEEFIESNRAGMSDEEVRVIRSMRPGAVLQLGGGAQAAFVLRCVAGPVPAILDDGPSLHDVQTDASAFDND